MPYSRSEERKRIPLEKLNFRPLVPEDLSWLDRCRDTTLHPFTALSAVSLVTWAETYGLTVAGDDDFYVIHSRYDNGYYAPVGNPDKCAAFIHEAAENEGHPHFVYVTEADAKALAGKGWSMHFRGDLSEYVASSSVLAMLPGTSISESFRRKCRTVARTFGGYEVNPVKADHLDRLWDIADRFRDAQNSMPSDQAVLETELKRYTELNMRGIILTMPDRRGAFILGYENTPEMFTMTMTRHDPTLPPETTAVCIHEFACWLHRKYPLINVEEDMGLDGLRRSKLLLSPVDFLKVYEVFP